MNEPRVTQSRVVIYCQSDNGDSVESQFTSTPQDESPHQALMRGFAELSRLVVMFGYEAKALEQFNAARKRVAIEHAARGLQK